MTDDDRKAYPWALRVERFDDLGIPADLLERAKAIIESTHGRPCTEADIDAMRADGLGWMRRRSEWRDGLWKTEPDLVEWRGEGLPYPMLVIRGPQGAWCGYVGVPPGHPLHGQPHSGTDAFDALTVSITFTGASFDCVLLATGEPPVHWWIGFDCSHVMQYSPALEAVSLAFMSESVFSRGHYVALDECREKVEELALELVAYAKRRTLGGSHES